MFPNSAMFWKYEGRPYHSQTRGKMQSRFADETGITDRTYKLKMTAGSVRRIVSETSKFCPFEFL